MVRILMDEQRYTIEAIIPVDAGENDILERAASLNYLADLSIAETLVTEAKKRGLRLLPATKFELIPGKGVKALIDGMEVRVGSPKFLVEERIAVATSFAETIQAHSRAGKVVITVLSGRSLSGAIILSSSIRRKPDEVQSAQAKKPFFGSIFTMSLVAALAVVLVVLICIAWYQN